MEEQDGSSKFKSYWCEHCKEFVSKTLYYQHKKKYYSTQTHTWSNGNKQFEGHKFEYEDFVFSDEGKPPLTIYPEALYNFPSASTIAYASL